MTPVRVLHTDAEFERLIPPLARAERELLEASLKKEGCREPLVIWAGHDVILDGHNRWAICTLHNISFQTVDVELPDREAARNWLIGRQFSRRNLSAAGASYLRGKRYLAEKGAWGGDRTAGGAKSQNGTLIPAVASVLEAGTKNRLAKEFRVGLNTILRDARFVEAVDALAINCGEQARGLILAGDAKITRQQVTRLAQMEGEEQKRLFAELQKGGRLPSVPRPAKPAPSLADLHPQALARFLLDQLGFDKAALVFHALADLLRRQPIGGVMVKKPA